MSVQSVESQDLAQFDQLKADVGLMIPQMMSIVVTDAATAVKAHESLSLVAAIYNNIEEKRDAAVRPLNQRVKSINSYANPIKAKLDELKEHVKGQLKAHEMRLAAIRAEDERKRVEAQRAEQARIEAEQRKLAAEAQAKRDAEIKAAEDARRLEAKRLADEAEAAAEIAAFGGSSAKEAEQKAEADRVALAAKAEADRIALAKRHELEQAVERARLERERNERDQAAKREAEAIAANRVKGSRRVFKVEVIDLKTVPWEFLKVELRTADAIAAHRAKVPDGTEMRVGGLRFYWDTEISGRSGIGAA